MNLRLGIHAACILLAALIAVSASNLKAEEAPSSLLNQIQEPQPELARPPRLSNEQRADIFMARKEYANAVEYYNRALKVDFNSPESKAKAAGVWNKIGIAYQQETQYQKARKAYQEAIRIRPDFAEAWNNLGTVYYLRKKVKKSLRYYQHAVNLKPLTASFHLNLGTAYFVRKKYDIAFQEYHRALELNPNILQEYSPMGTTVETRHAGEEFYFYMAKVFASLGRAEEAVRYLQRAMEEGLTDQQRILDDPDIQKISKDPAFVTLMKNPPTAIRN